MAPTLEERLADLERLDAAVRRRRRDLDGARAALERYPCDSWARRQCAHTVWHAKRRYDQAVAAADAYRANLTPTERTLARLHRTERVCAALLGERAEG